ncbi:WhiB family transcriptional regulator [Streptomyces sp. Da 82-17]|uniref:WhiB family transcriptional regulator n=1 Tax=Streptomyces sp. Da 82-17 TaxID=3377116 RepID=UPI0038D3A5C4
MSPNTTTISPREANRLLVEHRHYRYRSCAPDADDPTRAAGDLSVPVTAWEEPDLDGGEPQKVRAAREATAKRVCAACPVLEVCRAYANSVTADGKLAEPYSVRGGQTALERHKQLVATRHQLVGPAPDEQLQTRQKRAVLRALAAHTDPAEVAAAAGMDVRTANWQRARLVRLLNLPKTATRGALLAAAAERGLLEGLDVVADDGSVPAIPRPAATPQQQTVPATARKVRVPRPRGGAAAQLALFPVTDRAERLEAAA